MHLCRWRQRQNDGSLQKYSVKPLPDYVGLISSDTENSVVDLKDVHIFIGLLLLKSVYMIRFDDLLQTIQPDFNKDVTFENEGLLIRLVFTSFANMRILRQVFFLFYVRPLRSYSKKVKFKKKFDLENEHQRSTQCGRNSVEKLPSWTCARARVTCPHV